MARWALVVTSDRVFYGEREDRVTPLVSRRLEEEGHVLAYKAVVPNDPVLIRRAVVEAASWAPLVLVTGGTGASPRDVSVDVVESLADKKLPGLGEEFRRRSLASAGPRALLSRAEAFIVGGSLVFVSPGSPDAVRTALELLVEVDEHAVRELEGRGHA